MGSPSPSRSWVQLWVWCAWWCQGHHTHWDTCWWPLGQEPAAGHNAKWPLSHPCDSNSSQTKPPVGTPLTR